MTPERFAALWRSLAPIGRDAGSGGYVRYAWSAADLTAREWFVEEALDRDLEVETDGNGNIWAWWGVPGSPGSPPGVGVPGPSGADAGAVVTGSHLDSVPHGGAYDGPLGVVSALLAIDMLRERRIEPRRPIAVVVFAEEEGSRFGVPCLGSRLMTGAYDPARALDLRDRDGVRLADALVAAGADPLAVGPDRERLGRIGTFVELHVEQGRALADVDRPVGVATAIWPHGRWRLTVTGEGNHAGTTAMADRHDPMLTVAYAVLAANKEARLRGARATIGRIAVEPNATNAIPASVSAWLDARAAEESTLDDLIAAVGKRIDERTLRDGTAAAWTAESLTPVVNFDDDLRRRLVRLLGNAPVLPTGAGHDAGVLAAHVPTAMLFVRNPSGVSHAPGEHASDVDCAAGVAALADVLADLACRERGERARPVGHGEARPSGRAR